MGKRIEVISYSDDNTIIWMKHFSDINRAKDFIAIMLPTGDDARWDLVVDGEIVDRISFRDEELYNELYVDYGGRC